MKHNIKRAFALFIALLLAAPTFTFAEEPSDALIMLEEAPAEDPSIATVSVKGVVKGIKKGTVTITVTSSNGKTASTKIKVKQADIP